MSGLKNLSCQLDLEESPFNPLYSDAGPHVNWYNIFQTPAGDMCCIEENIWFCFKEQIWKKVPWLVDRFGGFWIIGRNEYRCHEGAGLFVVYV